MKKHTYISVIIGVISSILFSSCFTTMLVHNTRPEITENDKMIKLQSAVIDSQNNLIINFKGKLASPKKRYHHLIINMNELLQDIEQEKSKGTLQSFETYSCKNPQIANFSYMQTDSIKQFYITLKRESLKESDYLVSDSENILPFTTADVKGGKIRIHIQAGIFDKFVPDKYTFIVERYKHESKAHLAALPFTIVGDVITFPVQIVVLIIWGSKI